MATLAAAVEAAARMDTTKYTPVEHAPVQIPDERKFTPEDDPEPTFNHFLRCPIPLLNASPDSLRQFYRKGIPQYRSLPPQTN